MIETSSTERAVVKYRVHSNAVVAREKKHSRDVRLVVYDLVRVYRCVFCLAPECFFKIRRSHIKLCISAEFFSLEKNQKI